MSEKPTSSNREARRKTVGEVVTVWNSFLPALCVGSRIIALKKISHAKAAGCKENARQKAAASGRTSFAFSLRPGAFA